VVPITDAKAIAGKWTGRVRTVQGALVDVTLVVKDTSKDAGTTEGFLTSGGGQQVIPGKFRIMDGKIETETADGRKGTFTLYEREGKQVLTTYTEPGNRGEYSRAP
jgi:hypothetical protein